MDYFTISIVDPGGNSERNYKLFGCARYGCDSINYDWWAYEGKDGKSYCLHHRPLPDRIVSWWRERKELFLDRCRPSSA